MLGVFADPTKTTDSPDLGPPPVAHFEEGDPIKFDPVQEQSNRDGPAERTEETQPKFSVNLETRRKRRESSHRRDVDVKDAKVDSTNMATAMPTIQPLKSGAKRKLNFRDDDDQPAIVEEPGKQDFHFNRRSSDLRNNDKDVMKPVLSKAIKKAGDKVPQVVFPSMFGKDGKEKVSGASGVSATVAGTGRKVLGPSKCYTYSKVGEILTTMQRV